MKLLLELGRCHASSIPKGYPRETHAAVFWWDQQLGDFSTVHTEDVFHLSREDIPDDDGEIHPARDQVPLVIAGGHLVRVQQTRDFVPVTSERPVRGPAWQRGELRGESTEKESKFSRTILQLRSPNYDMEPTH